MNYKLKLLRSIIPLILNVSHYITDIIYLLYYLEKTVQDNNNNNKISNEYRKQLSHRIITLRHEFRELLSHKPEEVEDSLKGGDDDDDDDDDSDWKDEMDGIIKFQGLLNDDGLLILLYEINDSICNNIIKDDNKLENQLQNCFNGLNNIINFLNNVIDLKSKKIIYDNTIDLILNDELINIWKIEIDLLNCLIFDIMTHDEIILRLYELKNGDDPESIELNEDGKIDISRGDMFIKFITWLKNEQVFKEGEVQV